MGTPQNLRNSINALLEVGKEKDAAAFAKILEELKTAGGDFAKDAALIVEVVKQKVSKAPMDDRTMMVSELYSGYGIYSLFLLWIHERVGECFALIPTDGANDTTGS